jgi:uncharacterized membrane protein
MALLTAMTWGFTSVVLSLGLKDINPFVANSLRIPVVAILSVLAGLQRGNWRQLRDMDWATARLVILAGITGWGIGGSFFVSALQLAGPTRVAIVGATSPLFAVPLSALFLHERPTRTTLAGTLLTVLGVVLVVAA